MFDIIDIVNDKSLLIDYYYSEIGYLNSFLHIVTKQFNNFFVDYKFKNYIIERINYLSKYLVVYIDCLKFYSALNSRRTRLKKRLFSYVKKYDEILFITLTFNDDFINLSESSLYEYVKRFLNSLNVPYVANKDYGEKLGRLHYHCIVCTDFVDNKLWKYGSINFERVVVKNVDSIERLKNYIIKFTNHSFKDSTNKYIMYSRSKKNV